jgi:hypothetical protein
MSKEKNPTANPPAQKSVSEQFEELLHKGGAEYDNIAELFTGAIYDSLLKASIVSDLDRLWDIAAEATKYALSQYAGGNTELLVTTREAERQEKDMIAAAPGLDTHKLRNDPNDNLALAGRAEKLTREANETVNELTPEEKTVSQEQLVGPNVVAAAKELQNLNEQQTTSEDAEEEIEELDDKDPKSSVTKRNKKDNKK